MRAKKIRHKTLKLFLTTVILVLLIIGFVKYKDIWFNKEEKDIINKDNKDSKDKEDPYKNYKVLSYFKQENLNRYLAYKEKNPNYSYETVVTYVNIGLDYDFYSYINNANMDKDILVLMNKYYKLASDYEPNDLETIESTYFINGNSSVQRLRKEAKKHFEMMSQAAIENNTPVYGQSAYRTYSRQENLYNNAVNSMGKDKADNDTARPGHSEHQTGLTIDVSSTRGGNMESFANTDSFTWMQNNAYKYGFILRYPEGKTNITGFMYESWHYRYVGIKVATDMHENYPELTYEEYYVRFLDN